MTRKIVSLTTAFSFLLLIVSSVMLYIVPEGRIAYWAEWSVVFSKSQWGNLHITGGVLFIIFGLWHAILNFRAVINYCKAFSAAKKSSPVPLFASLGICLAVYAGTLWDVPPMRQLVSWNAEIKAHQAVKYGEPPFGHAEASSLRQFCAFLGMDIDTVLAAMQQAGIAYATDQIIDLIANGIRHIHVYSMNKPEVAGAIMNNLSEILEL